jgi:hypothetical protein
MRSLGPRLDASWARGTFIYRAAPPLHPPAPLHHQAWQKVVSSALVASTLVNVGTVLSVSAAATGAAVSFAGAALFGVVMLGSYLQVPQAEGQGVSRV